MQLLTQILNRSNFFLAMSDLTVKTTTLELMKDTLSCLQLLPANEGGDPYLVAVNDIWGYVVSILQSANSLALQKSRRNVGASLKQVSERSERALMKTSILA